MQKQKSVKINFIMNALLTMSSFIFPLITFPYVSQVLLPVGTGKVSFATSVITYFTMFAQLGIPTYGVRACAKVRDDRIKLSKTVQEILLINLIMSVITYIVFFISLCLIPKFAEEKTLFLIMSLTIIFNVMGMEWLYKALEQYSYITIRSIIFKFIALVLMFALVHSIDDYVIYGAITIVAAVGSNIFNLVNAHKYIDIKPVGKLELKKHLKPVMLFFAMSVATTVYTNLDITMIGFIKGDEETGLYNAAVRIKVILVSIVTSLGTVLLPRASYYIENGKMDEFFKITAKAINFVIIIASSMVLFFIIYAADGIYLLAGNEYAGSILSMQIIMPTLLFIGLSNVLGIQMLVPMGREREVLYSVIIGAVVDLIINIIAIPQIGAAGAAIGTVVAEVFVLIYQYYRLRDIVKDSFKMIQYWKIIIALVLGTIGSLWITRIEFAYFKYFFRLLFAAILFFGIYFGILFLLRENFVKEIVSELINRLMKRRKIDE